MIRMEAESEAERELTLEAFRRARRMVIDRIDESRDNDEIRDLVLYLNVMNATAKHEFMDEDEIPYWDYDMVDPETEMK